MEFDALVEAAVLSLADITKLCDVDAAASAAMDSLATVLKDALVEATVLALANVLAAWLASSAAIYSPALIPALILL